MHVIKHVLFFSDWSESSTFFLYQSVLPLVNCLICLRVQACLYARPGCGGMVHIDYVFVAKCKHL